MKAITKYPGAKWEIAQWIIDFFPPHRSYLEPFCGSCAVLLNKPRSCIETINDMDGDVVNLFHWIKNDPERLAHAVYHTPYARQVYDECYANQPNDSFDQAVNFLVCLNMGIGSRTTNGKSGWKNDVCARGKGYSAKKWTELPTLLVEAAERLRGVQIENKPAIELMRRFNDQKVLIYLDPPYLYQKRNKKQYRKEMGTEEEHAELLEVAKAHKGPVVISGYDSDLYNNMLAEWKTAERIAHAQTGDRRTEKIWMNYDPSRQMSLEDCLGNQNSKAVI